MSNHIGSVGYLGFKRRYLDISREEAIARYIESESSEVKQFDCEVPENLIDEFDFEDESLCLRRMAGINGLSMRRGTCTNLYFKGFNTRSMSLTTKLKGRLSPCHPIMSRRNTTQNCLPRTEKRSSNLNPNPNHNPNPSPKDDPCWAPCKAYMTVQEITYDSPTTDDYTEAEDLTSDQSRRRRIHPRALVRRANQHRGLKSATRDQLYKGGIRRFGEELFE